MTTRPQTAHRPNPIHPNRQPPGTSHPVDIHAGARLRDRRKLLGISQEQLADTVGLTFQQIQKYERGANRMGASRLYQFADVLEVPVTYFFEDLPAAVVAKVKSRTIAVDTPTLPAATLADPKVIAMMGRIQRLPEAQRQAVNNVVSALLKEDAPAAAE